MPPATSEVVIVGAGPSGLALAIALRLQGIDATLVDRRDHAADTSRAGVIHARTLEVLDPLGVTSTLLEHGIVVPTFRVRDRDRVLLDIDFSHLDTPYPYTLMCPQEQTEQVLRARLEALGGHVEWSTELVGLHLRDDGVTATLRTTAGTTTLASQWVAGCDGMHSFVREASGIGFAGRAYAEAFVLADVTMDWPIARNEVDLFLAPDGLVVVGPLPPDRFRIVATVDDAPETPDIAFMQAVLERRGPSDARGTIHEMVWSSRFRVHHRLAKTPRAGRVVLCGDAAHVHSPAGGQGMNTGIQDAVALARPLSRALRQQDAAGIDAWATERHAVAAGVVSLTDRMTRAATLRSRPARMARNLALAAVGRVPGIRGRIARRIAELDN